MSIAEICATLRAMADGLELCGVPDVGPWPLLKIEQHLGGAVLRLRTIRHPDAIRARADKLLKQSKSRTIGGTPGAKAMRGASRWRPSATRAKWSDRVARTFIEDGERDNHTAYCDLFE